MPPGPFAFTELLIATQFAKSLVPLSGPPHKDDTGPGLVDTKNLGHQADAVEVSNPLAADSGFSFRHALSCRRPTSIFYGANPILRLAGTGSGSGRRVAAPTGREPF